MSKAKSTKVKLEPKTESKDANDAEANPGGGASSSSSTRKRVICTNAAKGMWLVKVPKYLSEKWQQSAGAAEAVGNLEVIDLGKGETKIQFVASNSILDDKGANGGIGGKAGSSGSNAADAPTAAKSLKEKLKEGVTKGPQAVNKRFSTDKYIPQVHDFEMQNLTDQSLALISEDKSGLDEPHLSIGRLCVEGKVMKKAECRPPKDSNDYFQLKTNRFRQINQPTREVKQLDKVVFNQYKPISEHADAIDKNKQKKEGNKTFRSERDDVIQMLFKAFEKNQFYRFDDLRKVTNQPQSYLKEILADVGHYVTASGPNRNMWELKPEYRSYNEKKS